MGLQWECCREPWVKCTGVADELKLAHNSLKSLKQNHGPTSYTAILRQWPCFGPSGAQRAASQESHVGLQWECCWGPWVKCAGVADELKLAHNSLKSLKQNPRMGPLPAPQYSGNGLVLAHRERNGLLHENLVWACSRSTAGDRGLNARV